MIIGVTGHRNRTANPDEIRSALDGATLVLHGGAAGFDQQVAAIANQLGIATEAVQPDYTTHGRAATFVRNRQIVDRCHTLLACYDGRTTGGTYDTIRYATRHNTPITYAR